jgi:hypothetical protein
LATSFRDQFLGRAFGARERLGEFPVHGGIRPAPWRWGLVVGRTERGWLAKFERIASVGGRRRCGSERPWGR